MPQLALMPHAHFILSDWMGCGLPFSQVSLPRRGKKGWVGGRGLVDGKPAVRARMNISQLFINGHLRDFPWGLHDNLSRASWEMFTFSRGKVSQDWHIKVYY